MINDIQYSLLSVFVFLAIPFMAFSGVLALSKQGGGVHKINFFFVFMVSAMIMLLRDPTAPQDYNNYEAMYLSLASLKDVFGAYHGNYVFSFFQFSGKKLGLSHEAFSLVFSALCVAVAAAAIYMFFDNKKHAVLCLVMFSVTSTYILLFTNVVRQGFALSLFMLGLAFFRRRSYLWTFVFFALSVFSHSTALILIMAFLGASFFKPTGWKRSFLIIAIPIMPFIGGSIMGGLSDFGAGLDKIDKYSEYEYDNSLVYVKAALLYIFFVFFCWLERINFFKEGGEAGEMLLNAYTYVLIVIFLSLPILIVSSRFLYYASAFLPFFFSLIAVNWRVFPVGVRVAFFFCGLCFYGYFSFLFPSTAMQLGLT